MFCGSFPKVYGAARARAVREGSSVTEVAQYLLVSYEFSVLSDIAYWITHPTVMKNIETREKVS